MDTTITLQQNIPTPAWGMRLIAANVHEGAATVIVEPPGEPMVKHQVGAGDTVPFGDRALHVDEITGGGDAGLPGRASGRVTLSVVDGADR